jgi:hypothetical protein
MRVVVIAVAAERNDDLPTIARIWSLRLNAADGGKKLTVRKNNAAVCGGGGAGPEGRVPCVWGKMWFLCGCVGGKAPLPGGCRVLGEG